MLWVPAVDAKAQYEPSRCLCSGRLKIGDVGIVIPEYGSFDIFFNMC